MYLKIKSKILRLEKAVDFMHTHENKISVVHKTVTELMRYIHSQNSEKLPKDELYACVIQIIRVVQIENQRIDYLLAIMKKNISVCNHSVNVAFLAAFLAIWGGVKYCYEQLFEVVYAALLHDIGKLRIESKVFKTNSNNLAFELIKEHPQYSYDILVSNDIHNHNILYAVLHHHENFDGSGYPRKVYKDDIHEYAAIIRVCDVFDLLTNELFGREFTFYETLMMIKVEMKNKINHMYIDRLIHLISHR